MGVGGLKQVGCIFKVVIAEHQVDAGIGQREFRFKPHIGRIGKVGDECKPIFVAFAHHLIVFGGKLHTLLV